MEKIKRDIEWYDNPNIIVNMIIFVTAVTIIFSQAFAVKNNIGAINTFKSIFNHNTMYIVGIIYFILIKTKTGKKYFNMLNIIYIIIYLFLLLASILTIFQSFGIISLASFLTNLIILLYMIWTFLSETRLWDELKLSLIPFDEIKNKWYFYSICMLSSVVLIVNLISSVNFDSVVIALFDTMYYFLLARYIYLYKEYQEGKKKVIKNEK